MLVLLLKLRLKVLINSFRRGSRTQGMALVVSVFFALMLVAMSFSAGFGIFTVVNRSSGFEGILSVLNISFASFFIFMLFSSLTTAFYTMFASPDIPIWITAPIRTRTIFLEKFIEVFLGGGAMYAVIIFPALLSLGFVLGNILYFIILPLVSILYVAIPAGFGMLIMLLGARFIKPARAKEVFATIGSLTGIFIYLTTQLLSPGLSNNIGNRMTALRVLRSPLLDILPTSWVSQVLAGVGFTRYSHVILPGLTLLVFSVGIFILSLTITEKVFYAGLTRMSDLSTGKKKARSAKKLSSPALLSGPVMSIVYKDLKYLSRDMQEWIQFLMPLVVIFVFIFRMKNGSGGGMAYPGFNNIRALPTAGFLIFFMIMIALRLSLTGLGRERLSFWVIHQAPIDRSKIIAAKVITAYLPSIILASFIYAVLGIVNNFSSGILAIGILMISVILLGVNALGVMIGCYYPRFDAANPKQLIQGPAAYLYMMLSAIYVAIALGIFLLPQLGRFIQINTAFLWMISITLLCMLVAGSTSIFIWLAIRQLNNIEVT